MVTEGVLAMPGQRIMIEYTADHDLYPGFNEGFSLVEQDEHRHIAFGVRFLKDVCDERPEMKGVILRRLERAAAEGGRGLLPAGGRRPLRLRLLRTPLLADLRLRLPGAEAPHGGDRDRDPAAGGADAGPGRLRRAGGAAGARRGSRRVQPELGPGGKVAAPSRRDDLRRDRTGPSPWRRERPASDRRIPDRAPSRGGYRARGRLGRQMHSGTSRRTSRCAFRLPHRAWQRFRSTRA